MTTIARISEVQLDPAWVDCILVTAFDSQYGGCNYWVNEDADVKSILVQPAVDDSLLWASINLQLSSMRDLKVWSIPTGDFNGLLNVARLDAMRLSWACGQILNDEHLRLTDTAIQLQEALRTPNELPDLDAEAADVIVQVACFGEVVYG